MFRIRNYFIAILALLIPTGSFAGQPHCCTCSQKTVVGTYALVCDGTVMMTLEDSTPMPAPIVGLSIVTIDREGTVSAYGYMAVGDQITRFGIEPNDPEMSGEITVNSNCTGTVDWGEDMVGELIVQNGGDEISSLMIQGGPLGLPIVTGRWKRISRVPDIHNPRLCWWSKVVGTYVARQSGVAMIPGVGPVPGAFLGRASIGYDDTIEFSGTAMVAGIQMPFTLADGMWEKGELACTGRMFGDIMAGGMQYMGEVETWVVVLDGGNELWGIGLADPSGSPVALMTAKRTSWRPTDLE